MIEWKTSMTGLPLGVPLMVCVRGLDGDEDTVVGPVYALEELDGKLNFFSVETKKRFTYLYVYAWVPWPRPLVMKKGVRI